MWSTCLIKWSLLDILLRARVMSTKEACCLWGQTSAPLWTTQSTARSQATDYGRTSARERTGEIKFAAPSHHAGVPLPESWTGSENEAKWQDVRFAASANRTESHTAHFIMIPASFLGRVSNIKTDRLRRAVLKNLYVANSSWISGKLTSVIWRYHCFKFRW